MSDPAEMNAWLARDDGDPVPVRGSCSIGRAPTNQLVLQDEKVSRKHAIVHRQGEDEYWLVDLGSSNGTYLNGRRVSQPVVLRDRSAIRIGSSTLVFRQKSAAPLPADGEPEWSMQTIQDIRVAPCWLLLADIEGSTELARSLPVDTLPIVTGRWFSECKQCIEANGGSINKYLGDGFFAYWAGAEGVVADVVRALAALKRLQEAASPPFRIVVHHGHVSMGGTASLGEESLAGPEVNFVFRMEKLAGSLGHRTLISEAGGRLLPFEVPTQPAGRHPLSGFEGEFAFLTF